MCTFRYLFARLQSFLGDNWFRHLDDCSAKPVSQERCALIYDPILALSRPRLNARDLELMPIRLFIG